MRTALIFATVITLGCSDATGISPAVGFYDLKTVASMPLPARITAPDQQVEITLGWINLRADWTWDAEVYLKETIGNNQPVEVRHSEGGTFEVSRDTIYFVDQATGARTPGILRGTEVSADREGVTFTFVRR